MGKIVIHQTDEKQTVILTNDADGIQGVYFGEDGVEKPVGGVKYKRYKIKQDVTASSNHFAVPVMGTLENYGQNHQNFTLCAIQFYQTSPGKRLTARTAGAGIMGEKSLTNTEGVMDGAAIHCTLNIYFDEQYTEYINNAFEEVE